MNNTIALILGSDANAYYMARCWYEFCGEKAFVLAKSPLPFTAYSDLIKLEYDDRIWEEAGFMAALRAFREKHPKETILLVSSNESYARFMAKNREELTLSGFVFAVPDSAIADSFMMKEVFYKTYADSELDLPRTWFYSTASPDPLPCDLPFPLVLKPSNVIAYNHLSFPGKSKIYQIRDHTDLENTVSAIRDAGYRDTLILQDLIPGDDSFLFDAVSYVGADGKVKVLSFARIGLQEHTKNMVGNAAILINGYVGIPGAVPPVENLRSFLERIGYRGWAEFDLKYDARDNTFKVLEINARQGRSSYYVTKLGKNLMQVLYEDLIEKKDLPFCFLDSEVLLSFVPRGVAKQYVRNREFLEKALSLWGKNGNPVNPVNCRADRNFKRRLYLWKKRFRYYKEYKNGYWKEKICADS